MRTWSLISILSGCRLYLGKFDTFLHDVADLAFNYLQHARKRRTQGLLHLHDFKRQDRCALLQFGAYLGQQCDHCAGQRRDDLVFTDLLLVVTAKGIDPVQVETTVTWW